MNSKRDNQQDSEAGSLPHSVSRQKTMQVDSNSQQATAPGAGAPDRGNQQFTGANDPNTASGGASQAGLNRQEAGVRGGAGAQQTGWAARQQADRLQGRADEARQGEPQQSGYGGAEQKQHAGSQESPTGTGTGGRDTKPQARDDTALPPSDAGSRQSSGER